MLERWLLALSLIAAVASPTSMVVGAVSPVFAEAFGGAWLPLSFVGSLLAAAFIIAFREVGNARRLLAWLIFSGSVGLLASMLAFLLWFARMSANFD